MLLRTLILSLLVIAGAPARPDPSADTTVRFPSLTTTLSAPQADHGPLRVCSVLDARRVCEAALAQAWCFKQGFVGYEAVTIETAAQSPTCREDEETCRITTITCRRPAIVGD